MKVIVLKEEIINTSYMYYSSFIALYELEKEKYIESYIEERGQKPPVLATSTLRLLKQLSQQINVVFFTYSIQVSGGAERRCPWFIFRHSTAVQGTFFQVHSAQGTFSRYILLFKVYSEQNTIKVSSNQNLIFFDKCIKPTIYEYKYLPKLCL